MSDCGIVRIITCTSFGILFSSALQAVFSDASAWCAYDAANESQVADLMLDAIDIARTPLMERN